MLKTDGLKFEAALSATETEKEEELRSLQAIQRRKMQLSSEKSAEAYAEVEQKKAEVQTLQQTLRNIEAELNDLRERSKTTKKNLEESQQMCRKVEEQLEERSSVVSLRDDHVAKLRENESHLEGFRFLLYHKVKSLESERGPLAEYVEDLRSTVKKMYEEFVQVYRAKTALGQEVLSTGAKVNSLVCEQKDLRATKQDAERYGQFLFSDIADVMETFDETTVKRRLREILKKYDPSKQHTAKKEDKSSARLPLITEEAINQRNILLRTGRSTTAATKHIRNEHAKDLQRMQADHGALIGEVNNVMMERASYERRTKHMEAQVAELEAQLGPAAAKQGDGGKARHHLQTPYQKRLAASRSENHLTKVRAWRNQLPPPREQAAPKGPRQAAHAGTGTREEAEFDALLEDLDDTRHMMEQQGFKVGKLHDSVEHMVEERLAHQKASASPPDSQEGALPASASAEALPPPA